MFPFHMLHLLSIFLPNDSLIHKNLRITGYPGFVVKKTVLVFPWWESRVNKSLDWVPETSRLHIH